MTERSLADSDVPLLLPGGEPSPAPREVVEDIAEAAFGAWLV
jgi:hypothetical protein